MFFIRADGNKRIGAGHMMRCLTIADALRKRIYDAVGENTSGKNAIWFVCADEDSAKLAEDYGFAAKVLHSDYRNPEEELSRWEEMAGQESVTHTILVDSYYVTSAYLQALGKYGKVVLLDDMQRECYPVDVVMNYNAFASEEMYQKLYAGTATQICAGSRYVPIRPQFLHREYWVKDKVERVLITTGGGDVDNIAGRILKLLLETEQDGVKLEYDLIVGKYNPHREELNALAEEHVNIHIHEDVKDMAGLMELSDLAITAGGTTIYELATVGVPFICFSYAENQELLTEYIGERQIAGYAGAYHKDAEATMREMKRIFLELAGDKEKRNDCHVKETQMIDGLGAERIVEDALLKIIVDK